MSCRPTLGPMVLLASLLLMSLPKQILSQLSEQEQQTIVDDAHDCPSNIGDPAPLEIIRPQLYYFKVGGGAGTSNGDSNTYRYVFNYGYDNSEFTQANINASLPTKVLVHGFEQSFNGTDNAQLQSIVDTLNQSPITTYNVYVLNWPNEFFPARDGVLAGYQEVANSTRAVGNYLGQFLIRMQDTIGLNLNRTHLLGFSFGGQVVGFAGKYLNSQKSRGSRLGRITGLDPAGPCFQDVPSRDRLAPSDATYVDTIHTSRYGFGTSLKSGNRDVIVNNGRVQPGCSSTNYYCSHLRVFDLYNYEPNPSCHMIAYQCNDYRNFTQGNCQSCQTDSSECNLVNFPLNFGADEYSSRVGDYYTAVPSANEARNVNINRKPYYYVQTGDIENSPACLQHYQVRVYSAANASVSQIVLDSGESQSSVELHEQEGYLNTGLLTFSGEPIRFTGARVTTSENGTVYASVAFMSQLSYRSRDSYSSYLCSSSDDSNQLGSCEDSDVDLPRLFRRLEQQNGN